MNTLRVAAIACLQLALLVAANAPTRGAEPLPVEERSGGKPGLDRKGASPPAYAPDMGSLAAAQEPTVEQFQPRGDVPADADERPRLNAFWDHGAVLESSDKAFRLHVGGRIEFDNTWYQYTRSLPFTLEDGADMRRARLRADGTIGETVDFMAEVNFANIQDVTNESNTTQIGSVGLTNFYVTFKDVPYLENVRLGHFKQPIGLEHLTSGNDLYYMERSPGHDAFFQPFQFVDGVMAFDSFWDDRATAALALTRVGKQTMSPFGFNAGQGEYAATGRLTGLPVYEDEGQRLLHVGVGYSLTGVHQDFDLANRPLVRAGAGSQQVPNIIGTGQFYTPDPVQILNTELAVVCGRFSMSTEYQLVRGANLFEQFSGGTFSGPRGNVAYQGVYAEMGLFLTPDYRRYDRKEGTWGRQIVARETATSEPPDHGFFASHTPVQLVCRYSYLDLASGSPVLTPSSGVQAGWENDITAGLDWYINSQVHFLVNYVYTHLEYVNHDSGVIHGLGCRLHVDF